MVTTNKSSEKYKKRTRDRNGVEPPHPGNSSSIGDSLVLNTATSSEPGLSSLVRGLMEEWSGGVERNIETGRWERR